MLAMMTACDGKGASPKDSQPEPTAPPTPTPVVDANAITFESGDLFTAHAMEEKDYANDESRVKLTVEPFNGTQQLRIQVLDQDPDTGDYKVPKVVFQLAALVGAENLGKIDKISCDMTAVAVGNFTDPDTGTQMLVPGNLMGAFCGNLAEEKQKNAAGAVIQNAWTTHGPEFAFSAWEWNWGYFHYETNALFNDVNGTLDAALAAKDCYETGYEKATLVLMRWGIPNQADLYLDNLTFWDRDGKSIPIVYSGTGDGSSTK